MSVDTDPEGAENERRSGTEPPTKKPPEKQPKPEADPLAWARLPVALLRRPLISAVGVVACAVASLVGVLLGSSADALLNLVSYLPLLGGGWAVLAAATSTPDKARAQLPSPRAMIAYAASALVVVVLSGIAEVTLTIIGGLIVRTALALGPTVALAEGQWPHQSLWRGLLVIDAHPRAYLKVAVLALVVALVFALLFSLVLGELFGQAASGRLADGAARGVGWTIVGAIWMRFYLLIRSAPPAE